MPFAPILWQMSVDQVFQPLPYIERLEPRPAADIDLIVIHATETPTLALARELALDIHYCETRTGNSGHYYIDLTGRIVQYVPDDRTAHHVAGCNARSIGIELVNAGRYPNWFHSLSQSWTAAYPAVQLVALKCLIAELRRRLPGLRWIARHSDLDRRRMTAIDDPDISIARKLDPGPTFPWIDVAAASGLKPVEHCPLL